MTTPLSFQQANDLATAGNFGYTLSDEGHHNMHWHLATQLHDDTPRCAVDGCHNNHPLDDGYCTDHATMLEDCGSIVPTYAIPAPRPRQVRKPVTARVCEAVLWTIAAVCQGINMTRRAFFPDMFVPGKDDGAKLIFVTGALVVAFLLCFGSSHWVIQRFVNLGTWMANR